MAGNHIPHGHPQRQKNLASFMQGSHVVDENNNPLRLYHGTADDFDEFKHGHMNKKDAGWLGRGFYFTNSPSLANSYAMIKRGKAENVMPVHLALKNPFYATTEHKAALKQALEEDPFAAEDFRNKLIDAGHDGVILDYGTPDKVREYVAFNPNQIKSAIGNSGTFDPTNPNITKADGGIVGDPDTDEGITAYHGSPHDFERFDMSKIGTGEGAQAYGHGLYFAEHEPIAKSYRDALTKGAQNMRIDGNKFTNFYNSMDPEKNLKAKIALNMLHGDRDIHDAIDWQIQQTLGKLSSKRLLPEDEPVLQEDLMRLRSFKKQPPVIEKNPGHMYEVRINAHPDHFLDWDKALWEQPEAIRRLAGWSPEHEKKYYDWQKNDTDSLLAALEGNGDHTPTRQPVRPQGSLPMSTKGSDIYEHIKNKFGAVDWPIDADAQTRATYRNGAAHRASQHLLEHGIKGIKYLDAGSRGASDNPTRNYVVFDDKLVNVKRKYAKGGTVQRSPKLVSDGSIVNRALMLTSKKA